MGSPYVQSLLGNNQLPNFKRLQDQGAWTLNARSDYGDNGGDIETLPNHVSMVTGRPVWGTPEAHLWTSNSTPPPDVTIHSNKGSYVSSVYDVVGYTGPPL